MKLPLLTNSECRAFRSCPRSHHYRYTLGVRPVHQREVLRFGTAVHAELERIWRDDPFEPVMLDDAYETAKCEAMISGYLARWGYPHAPTHVEVEFRAPLINPDTGYASSTYELGGKLDALYRDERGDVWIVEHKTTSEDITPGSDYWKRLRLDTQVSTYHVGARALGYEPRGVLYDVLRKPALQPLLATPEESRKYTKKTGELYANQRAHDETPAEYGARIRAAIAEDPDRYYQRATIVRLADEELEAARDLWETAGLIREARRLGRHPKNPDACVRWGSQCEFFPVCTGETTIDNPTRYRLAERPHEELAAQ